jgi:heme/copper-type cytochrome/quinol oxidase subunit 3
MTGRYLDVSGLPPFDISNKAPLWWGQLMMCLIEGTMFAILIGMYFYLRLGVDVWPPPGAHLPAPILPAFCTASLLISCLGSYWASEGSQERRPW